MLYLANRLLTNVYNNAFKVTTTTDEIAVGSIGKFIFESTLLWLDIKLAGALYICTMDVVDNLSEMYRQYIRKSSTNNGFLVDQQNPKPISVIYDKLMIIPKCIVGGAIMLLVFISSFPHIFIVPTVGFRIINNICKNKLHILKN